MIIKGSRLKLIPITAEHTPLIVKWRNNPNVRENFVYRETMTEEIHNSWLKNKVETGEVVQFIISKKEEELPIGSVFLRDIDYCNKKAEFGIFIGEDSERGKGYGKEAAFLICNYGFDVLELHKITLRVFTYNKAAIKSYEKVGFEQEALFKDDVKINNKYEDMIYMALFKHNLNNDFSFTEFK